MKNLFLLIAFSITILSCGQDNLSNSKAENIIKKCLEDAPIQRKAVLQTGEVTFNIKAKSNKLKVYENLRDNGFIEMTEIKQSSSKDNSALSKWMENMKKFNIKATSKVDQYTVEGTKKDNHVQVKIFLHEVDKVLEVQEIPAKNTARVKVQYKAVDITPFASLSAKDPEEPSIKNLTMKKTSNGWKYCDNY